MELKHARVRLKLHTLRPGEGNALLLLHALGGDARDWDADTLGWTGPVYALDLAGHGRSGRLYGGAYQPSLWAADADVALDALGGATLVGAGMGAYVALLVAGARSEQVPAAVLLPGAGLSGLAPEPRWDQPWPFGDGFASTDVPPMQRGVLEAPATDPTIAFGDLDLRPPDYSDAFARRARRVVLLDDDAHKPPWWQSLRRVEEVEQSEGLLCDALKALNSSTS